MDWLVQFLAKWWLELILGGITTAALGLYRKATKRQKAIEDGVRDMLRLTILDNYERCKKNGMISVSRKDAIDSAYQSYHALGGNGVITQVHGEIMAMPILTDGNKEVKYSVTK